MCSYLWGSPIYCDGDWLVWLCSWAVALVVLIAIFGILLLRGYITFRRNEKIIKEAGFLEALLKKAANENLEDARNTLSPFYTSDQKTLFIPRYFWEINDVDILARTLRTLLKLSEEEMRKNLLTCVAKKLRELAKSNPRRAFEILAHLGSMDKELAVSIPRYVK
ncbi:MAG: hypothetical protein NTZ49_03325 [Candidatus Parcubacteria bacterium]|nr:hypothetical protein [Candidatus Parcubacteria bacterium]